MDCSTPGFPVPHHFLKFAQVHVHCISDAIQPSHPLMSWYPSVLNLSQHPGTFPMSQLFASDGQNTGVSASASVLPMSIQGWFPWRLTGLIPLQSKGLSGVFSSTTVQKHQFFDTLPSLQSSSHSHTWPLGGRVLFNTLSRFVIAFMSRRCNIISCLASVSDLLHSVWQSLYHVVTPIFFASVCFSEHTSFCSIFLPKFNIDFS